MSIRTVVDEANHDSLATGDIDHDGDVDLVFGYGGIWLNDGAATFSMVDQSLPESDTVNLSDVDGDGDMDAILGMSGANQIWTNETLEPTAISTVKEPEAGSFVYLPVIE